jgi:hypothetical protein
MVDHAGSKYAGGATTGYFWNFQTENLGDQGQVQFFRPPQ